MAAWKDDSDIAKDLDALSGFKSPTGRIKSYTSWGRGHKLDGIESSAFTVQNDKPVQEEFQWFKERQMGKLPESLNRGKMLEILKENCLQKGKELEVQEQLRAAVGPGYSNELIEATFKQRLGLSDVNGVTTYCAEKQFEDVEESKSPAISSGVLENTSAVTFDTNPSINSNESESVKIDSPVQLTKKSKRSARRYRNAVLESLEKMYSTADVANSNANKANTEHSSHIEKLGCQNASKITMKSYNSSLEGESNSFAFSELDFPKL